MALHLPGALCDAGTQASIAEDQFFVANTRVEIVEHRWSRRVQDLLGEARQVLNRVGLRGGEALVEVVDRRDFRVRDKQRGASVRCFRAKCFYRHGVSSSSSSLLLPASRAGLRGDWTFMVPAFEQAADDAGESGECFARACLQQADAYDPMAGIAR